MSNLPKMHKIVSRGAHIFGFIFLILGGLAISIISNSNLTSALGYAPNLAGPRVTQVSDEEEPKFLVKYPETNSTGVSSSNVRGLSPSPSPFVKITSSLNGSQLTSGILNVTGTAALSSAGNRINRVEVALDENLDTYKLATPIAPNDWSKWSVQYNIPSGVHTLTARVTDIDRKQDWNSIVVTRPMTPIDARTKIAIVSPTFTWAAYSYRGFYNFYDKHLRELSSGKNVTEDLNLLTAKIPHGPFRFYADPPTEGPYIPGGQFMISLQRHLQALAPYSLISNLEDADIHNGKILTKDGSNAYDTLILFHAEYMTQQGYENLRRFVTNGGTILFADSNGLTTKVTYDSLNDSITLVKGHNVEFNGKVASRGPPELWLDENKDWRGGNFLDAPTYINVTLTKLPFKYSNTNKTHIEEQIASNPNSKVLLNYGAVYPKDGKWKGTVGTYEYHYGEGRVIETSVFAHSLNDDPKFWSFMDHIILPRVIAPSFIVTPQTLENSDKKLQYEIFVLLHSGNKVGSVKTESLGNNNLGKVTITLEAPVAANKSDNITAIVPKALLAENVQNMVTMNDIRVLVNGKERVFKGYTDDVEFGIAVSLDSGDKEIQIVQSSGN